MAEHHRLAVPRLHAQYSYFDFNVPNDEFSAATIDSSQRKPAAVRPAAGKIKHMMSDAVSSLHL